MLMLSQRVAYQLFYQCLWLFDDAERRVLVRVCAYEGRNTYFLPESTLLTSVWRVIARIAQSGRPNIAMACKQNLTGRASLPPGTTRELDIPVYAARLMLHVCFQCHEKLSCYLFPS